MNDYTDPNDYPVDSRGLVFTFAFFTPKHLGQGQYYLMTIKDKDGNAFDGSATYRLNVPANAPVNLYWSATIYDRAAHALIRNMPRASRSSQNVGLQKNANGSVDVYFGPIRPTAKPLIGCQPALAVSLKFCSNSTDRLGRYSTRHGRCQILNRSRRTRRSEAMRNFLWVGTLFAVICLATSARAQLAVSPSPGWGVALRPGPDTRVKITDAYAALVARCLLLGVADDQHLQSKTCRQGRSRLRQGWPSTDCAT